jgi:hypothetical protein
MFFLSCGYEGPHLDLSEFFSGLTIGRIVFDGIYFWQRKTISLLFFFFSADNLLCDDGGSFRPSG